jgi:hypothetical protein
MKFFFGEVLSFIADSITGKIAGVTDDNRLKVDAILTAEGSLLYEDMNVANGGIARDTQISTAWTKVYDVTGDGNLVGFILTLEKIAEDWGVRLAIDGAEVFIGSTNGIRTLDLQDNKVYGFDSDTTRNVNEWIGFELKKDSLRYKGPNNIAIRYKTGIKIYVQKSDGNKKFRAGLVSRTDNL